MVGLFLLSPLTVLVLALGLVCDLALALVPRATPVIEKDPRLR